MRSLRSLRILGGAVAAAATLALADPRAVARAADAPPVAPVRAVTDTLWGVPVSDPYRYMENLKDPEVQTWMRGEADFAASTLERIPGRDELLERLKEFDAGRAYRVLGVRRMPGGAMFYQKIAAEENLAKLYLRPARGGDERLLVDPSTLGTAGGGHVSIEFYVPSPDGRRVAYGLAPSGSEEATLHVLDTASGQSLPDSIDRFEDAYTPPQWLPDGSGFFYERRRLLPADAPDTDGYKETRAYFHRLGTPVDADPIVFAWKLWPNVTMSDEDFPSIVLTPGSPFAIGKIKHGDSNPLSLYVARIDDRGGFLARPGGESPWIALCDASDEVTDFAVHGDRIDLLTSHEAPRFKVVRTSLESPDLAHAETIVPESEDVIDDIASTADALYLDLARGGASHVARVAHGGRAQLEPLALPDGFPSGSIASASPDVEGILLSTAAWTRAGRLYAFDPATKSFSDAKLSPTGKYDALPGFTSLEVEVKSHDGTMVPLSIVMKKGLALDGKNPTLLVGYGSYGISQNVAFSPTRLAWLERGGVYAVAHVRGGGENGEGWHRAGQMTTKPNTWKDFIACAEYLIHERYTSPEKLAGQGGSAGGILIGRAITDRPELFRAALLDVGLLDAVRAETTRNGVPNIQEFGTVKKEDQFKGLLEMSAYHHVHDGVKYPAVLLSHGANDPRVDPWNSGKMCARLQAATASGRPVLLRMDYHAGHGIGSTKLQALQGTADKYAFLLWQMETPGFLP